MGVVPIIVGPDVLARPWDFRPSCPKQVNANGQGRPGRLQLKWGTNRLLKPGLQCFKGFLDAVWPQALSSQGPVRGRWS
jgi:hypothetical protein